jgi:6-phosphogluconolactonase
VNLDRRLATSAFVEHRFADRDAVADALAAAVADDLRGAVTARSGATLAVSGGTTPAPFFRRLALQELDWARVVVTLCDERWVPPANERSNARLVRENLLQGAAAAARFVPLYAAAPDPETGLAEVGARIDALPAPFDIVTLGMGLDGHTASWFPGGDHLDAALDPNGTARVLPMRAPDAGEPRVTLTLPVLASARRSYLHFEGNEKLAVFEHIIRGEGEYARSPLRALLTNSSTPLEVYWSE